MFKNIQRAIFSLYERRVLRNWFYTFAFAIFVPVGCRFAILAWRLGSPVDRLMAIVGGAAVAVTTIVTLLRIWVVPPLQTVDCNSLAGCPEPRVYPTPDAAELLQAVKESSARNREIARAARALGSPRSLFH